jgi:plasmid replication initiation protein
MEKQTSIWEEQVRPQVRMHNDLILAQFGKLEMAEMKIFLIMLAKVEWGCERLKKIRVNLRDIDPNIIISDKNEHFKRAITAADALTEKLGNVKIQFYENGRRVWLKTSVLQSIKFMEGTDFVECTWGDAMAPYLLNLKGNFTTEELSELLKLKSTYAVRFYLLVKSLWRDNQVFHISVVGLRKMLLGDKDLYPDYKIFKRDVLNKSMTYLQKTSCAFRIDEERKGRTVENITIIPLRAKINLKPFSKDIDDLLIKYRVNRKKIQYMFSNDEITEPYIRFTFQMCMQKGKPEQAEFGGYVHEAIVNGRFRKEFEAQKILPSADLQHAAVPPKMKRIYWSIEDLQKRHLHSLKTHPDDPKDLLVWIQQIFITEGGYQMHVNGNQLVGVFKVVPE